MIPEDEALAKFVYRKGEAHAHRPRSIRRQVEEWIDRVGGAGRRDARRSRRRFVGQQQTAENSASAIDVDQLLVPKLHVGSTGNQRSARGTRQLRERRRQNHDLRIVGYADVDKSSRIADRRPIRSRRRSRSTQIENDVGGNTGRRVRRLQARLACDENARGCGEILLEQFLRAATRIAPAALGAGVAPGCGAGLVGSTARIAKSTGAANMYDTFPKARRRLPAAGRKEGNAR